MWYVLYYFPSTNYSIVSETRDLMGIQAHEMFVKYRFESNNVLKIFSLSYIHRAGAMQWQKQIFHWHIDKWKIKSEGEKKITTWTIWDSIWYN